MFPLFVRNLLYNLMVSSLSVETDTFDTVNSLDLSEHHSEMETEERSEETTDSVQQGVQLISNFNYILIILY